MLYSLGLTYFLVQLYGFSEISCSFTFVLQILNGFTVSFVVFPDLVSFFTNLQYNNMRGNSFSQVSVKPAATVPTNESKLTLRPGKYPEFFRCQASNGIGKAVSDTIIYRTCKSITSWYYFNLYLFLVIFY